LLNIVQKITGKKRRIPSNRAQLIALPNAVMIYTESGSVVVTPQLAKDIQSNLSSIIDKANKTQKLLLEKEDYELYSGRSFEEDFSEKRKNP